DIRSTGSPFVLSPSRPWIGVGSNFASLSLAAANIAFLRLRLGRSGHDCHTQHRCCGSSDRGSLHELHRTVLPRMVGVPVTPTCQLRYARPGRPAGGVIRSLCRRRDTSATALEGTAQAPGAIILNEDCSASGPA